MLREFDDDKGNRWRVWDINPVLHARGSSPQKGPSPYSNVPPGWLCFECETERRRLSPIPADWAECDQRALAALLDSAELVQRSPRDVSA